MLDVMLELTIIRYNDGAVFPTPLELLALPVELEEFAVVVGNKSEKV